MLKRPGEGPVYERVTLCMISFGRNWYNSLTGRQRGNASRPHLTSMGSEFIEKTPDRVEEIAQGELVCKLSASEKNQRMGSSNLLKDW